MTARPPCRRSAGDTLRFAQELTRSCRTGRSAPPPQLSGTHKLFSDVRGRIVPPYPDDHLARALAWGFLAAPEWSEPALVSAGQVTLGRRHRWLPRVVRPVLSAYRSAPLDRPSELAGFLLVGTPLPEVAARARQQRRPLRVQSVATVPGQMGVRRWPVPEIDDLVGLATLLELRSISSPGPPTSGGCSAGQHRVPSTSITTAGWRGRVPSRDCSSHPPRCCARSCGVSSTASSAGCPSIRRPTGSSAAGVL